MEPYRDEVVLYIHHGGRVKWNNGIVEYEGGQVDDFGVLPDYLSYAMLKKLGTEHLGYDWVDRMWYLYPGDVMCVHQMKEIFGDVEAKDEIDAASEVGDVHLFYLCGHNNNKDAGDNMEELPPSRPRRRRPDDDFEESIGVGRLIHFVDDSDRTTDPEFLEAMENLGVLGLRRAFRSLRCADGEEVDQLYAEIAQMDQEADIGQDEVEEGLDEGSDAESPAFNLADEDGSNSGSDADDEGLPETNVDVPHAAANVEEEFQEQDNQATPVSSYRGSFESDHDRINLSDDEVISPFDRQPWYDPRCDHKTLVFVKGLRFSSPRQFKDAVIDYCIAAGVDVYWVRSCQRKMEAICRSNCGWRVYASWYGRNRAFVVKSVGEPHSCLRALVIKQLSAKWIAKTYLDRFRNGANIDPEEFALELRQKHNCEVTPRTCYRAKLHAKKLLESTLHESYSQLRSYIAELKRVDPNGRFLMEVDPVEGKNYVRFKSFFVGFSGLINGFKAGCRPMFGLDGCFLKGEVRGMLLSAIGKDENNQMYPICWAVVEGENKESWMWFIEILEEELHLGDGNGWSVISDQQKVQINPILSVYTTITTLDCLTVTNNCYE
ncbi:hypothetical protein LINGRAPRIM_LOCUS2963 [Linum grandiflorum]